MEFISEVSRNLSVNVKNQLFQYRYKVFVELLKWEEVSSTYGVEKDQFDHDDTLYVIAKNNEDDIVGCARLLPTTSTYLLEALFPELLNGIVPPKSPDIWELSRFTSIDINNNETVGNSQFSSPTTIALLKESIACAKKHGAKRIISVSPIGVERLLRKIGFHAHRAGPPMMIDGQPIIACWIEIDF
jgi:N-acyl-L-homoserine lactone synthetase